MILALPAGTLGVLLTRKKAEPEGVPVQPQAGEQPPAPVTARLTREQVYDTVLRSTAFILGEGDGADRQFVASGSGSLVHTGRRLVLTNYHVVERCDTLTVFFPATSAKRELITNPKHYKERAKTLGVRGRVVATDPALDLALVQLDRLPASAEALPLAGEPAPTGSEVLSIGASGVELRDFSGTLWRLSSGAVRGRYDRSMTLDNGQQVKAMVLETQKPNNKGDSGGPTVNDRGQLVGVVSALDRRQDLITFDIDLTEVRKFLGSHATKSGWQWRDTVAAPPLKGSRYTRADQLNGMVADLKRQTGAELTTTIRNLAAHGNEGRRAIPELIHLLDHPDKPVASAAKEALEEIGDPGTAEEWCISKALSADRLAGCRYALTLLAERRKPTSDQITALTGIASLPLPGDRLLVVRAWRNVPTEAKGQAISPLLAALDDDAAAVADAAEKAIVELRPFPKDSLVLLERAAASPSTRMRLAAVQALASQADTLPDAERWFVPRLRDLDARVRTSALDALSKWGAEGGKVIPAQSVFNCLTAKEPELRVAAARAVGQLRLPNAIPKLLPLIATDNPAEVRRAATASLLALDPGSGDAADEVFTSLLAVTPLPLPELTLQKLGESGRPVKPFLPTIAAHLQGKEEKVRLAALRILAAGKQDSATWIAEIATLLSGSEDEAGLAAKCLSTFGKPGADRLMAALRSELTTTTRERIFIAMSKVAGESPPEYCARLIGEAEKLASGDLIAHAVASFDPAVAFPQLRVISRSELVGRPPAQVRKSQYAVAYQVWAIETAGLLDIGKLKEVDQKRLLDWLWNLSNYDGDQSCREAANRSHKLLEAKLPPKTEKKQ